MSDEREVLSVRILDKDYRISCPPEERESLVAAAGELNQRMQDMRGGTKVLGAERMAVMAALNVIHEREQAASKQTGALDSRRGATVLQLEAKLDTAIGRREST